MTVAELISELKRMPQHYYVVDDIDMFVNGVEIADIESDTTYVSFNRCSKEDCAYVVDVIEQLSKLPQDAIVLSPAYDDITDVYITDLLRQWGSTNLPVVVLEC